MSSFFLGSTVFLLLMVECATLDPTCNGVVDCSIDCSSVNCENTTIFASSSTDVTLNCYPSSNCSHSTIYCASSSCSINCGYYCNSMVIYTNTSTTALIVNCQYDNGCNSMVIWAETAASIMFNSSNYTKNVKIHGDNAESISISCSKDGSCTDVTIWATYVHSFSLIATYYGAYSSGTLYASEAASVSIICASWYRDFTACNGYWKLSDSGHNTVFNCYGNGCDDLGIIGVDNNASSLTISLNGCNECSDINKCIDKLQIYCNSGSDTFTKRYCNGGSKSVCGCDTMIDGISYTNDEDECVGILPVWLIYGSEHNIVFIIIIVASVIGVLCVLVFCLYIQCIYEGKSGDVSTSEPIIRIVDEDKDRPVPDDVNSIIIIQERSWSNHSYDLGCKAPRIPQWNNNITVNDFLMQCGLTQNMLNEEIQTINNKSNEFVKRKGAKCHYCGTIAWVLFSLSLIIIIALGSAAPPEKQDIYRLCFLIPWFFGCIGVIVYYYARREQGTIWDDCLKYIEAYIVEINTKYSDLSTVMNWSVQKIKIRHNNKCTERNTTEWHIATYNDILISTVRQEKQQINYTQSQ